ncbi:MAG: hypothetical protein PVG79_02725, partial [Gemmatimonadales bacterium]
MDGIQGFLKELKRRKVYHVAAAYVAASIVVATATAELFDDLLLPDWTPRLVILLLVIGFPIALVLAWAYEVRPEGGVQAAAEEKAHAARPGPPPDSGAPRATSRSVAVLPFDNMSPEPESEYFSDGITEELTNSLARVRDLKVAARTSAFTFRASRADVRQ